MVHFYASVLLTIIMFILAILYASSAYGWRIVRRWSQPTHPLTPTSISMSASTATSTLTSTQASPLSTQPASTYASRPHYYLLATTLIVVMAILVPTPVSIAYKAAILLGLLLTLLGTAAHMVLKLPALARHAIDLLVALLFGVTMMAHHPHKWPTPWLLVPLLLAFAFYLLLRPRLAELHSTLILYGLVLWFLLWQAIEVVTVQPGWWSWAAVIGMAGFVLIKALVATNYLFQRPPRTKRTSPRRSTPPAPTTQRINQPSSPIYTRIAARFGAIVTGQLTGKFTGVLSAGEDLLQRFAEAIRFPQVASWVTTTAPLFVLIYQWLLVLSIWGPALERYMGLSQ